MSKSWEVLDENGNVKSSGYGANPNIPTGHTLRHVVKDSVPYSEVEVYKEGSTWMFSVKDADGTVIAVSALSYESSMPTQSTRRIGGGHYGVQAAESGSAQEARLLLLGLLGHARRDQRAITSDDSGLRACDGGARRDREEKGSSGHARSRASGEARYALDVSRANGGTRTPTVLPTGT